jgi:hypothetical protein
MRIESEDQEPMDFDHWVIRVDPDHSIVAICLGKDADTAIFMTTAEATVLASTLVDFLGLSIARSA